MRSLLLPLVFSVLFIACGNEDRAVAESEALVEQYFSRFNTHNWERMANMYSETAEFKDPSLGAGIVKQTRQQVIDKYKALNAIFPDLHDRILAVYPSTKNQVIVEFI